MPIYEFRCKDCGDTFDSLDPKEHEQHPCTECGSAALVRVWRVNINKENIRAVPRG